MDTMKDTKMQPAPDAVIEELRKMQPTAWVYEDMLGRKCVGFERPIPRSNTHEPLFSAATHAVVMGLINRLEAAERKEEMLHRLLNAKQRDHAVIQEQNSALRAKIEQMERQAPVVWRWLYDGKPDSERCFEGTGPGPDVELRALSAEFPRTVQRLYLEPGAAPEAKP